MNGGKALLVAWCAKQSQVASLIAGARTIAQLEENARFLEVKIDDALDARLKTASEAVKRSLGANPDLWSGASRYR